MMNRNKRAIQEAILHQGTSIELWGQDLEDKDVENLVKECPRLTRVCLHSMRDSLLDHLAILPKLADLSIGGRMRDSRKISDFQKLRHLELNGIDSLSYDFFLELVKLRDLISLKLVDCNFVYGEENEQVAERVIELISRELKGLSSLVLDRSLSVSNRGLKYLSSMKLSSLKVFSWFDVDDEGMHSLRFFKDLKELDLSDYCISDMGIKVVSQLKSLAKLSLNFNRVTNRGLKYLNNLTELEELNLKRCDAITNEGLDELISLRNLKKITFNGKKIAHIENFLSFSKLEYLDLEECCSLCQEEDSSLSQLTSLKFLSLDSCYEIAIQCIAPLSSLETLILRHTRINDKELNCISSLLLLCHLDLSYCRHIAGEGFLHLIPLSNLKVLKLSNCEQLADEALRYIGEMKGLTHLDLSQCPRISDKGLSYLSGLTNLIELNLSECSQITDKGLSYLNSLKNLQVLILSKCHQIGDEGLSYLSKLSQLSDLNLHWCEKITNQGLQSLAPLDRNLCHLEVGICRHISGEGRQYLPHVEVKRTLWKWERDKRPSLN